MSVTRTVVTASVLITDPRQPSVPDAGVLIENGLITAVGPAEEIAALAPEARRWDFPGATMLPGLINAHVHLAFDVTTDPRPALERRDLDTVRATIAANGRAALLGGATTVRDLGDLGGLAARFGSQVADGNAVGPRVLSAGAPLTPPGGHCWFLGGEVDAQPSGSPRSDSALRAAVHERAQSDVDVIKIMASGGNLTPTGAPMWQSQFTRHDLEVVVAAARECGLPVAGHAHGTEAMALCAQSGVDTVEHASWRAAPGPDGSARYSCRDEVAEQLAASGATLVPTRARNWANWPQEAELQAHLDRLRWTDRHGIAVIAGNDAGVGQGYFDDLTDVLTLLHAAGWSTGRALASATTDAAGALGQGRLLGRIATGYAADLLVLNENPLEDLRALRQIRAVVARGRVHDPATSAATALP